MRLGNQEAFRHSVYVLNLTDMAHLTKGSNMLLHNNRLKAIIIGITTRYWFCVSSIDVPFINQHIIITAILSEALPVIFCEKDQS